MRERLYRAVVFTIEVSNVYSLGGIGDSKGGVDLEPRLIQLVDNHMYPIATREGHNCIIASIFPISGQTGY